MKPFDWVAAVVLFLQFPIPLFWLILHPGVGFWRQHVWAGYWVAGLSAWGTLAVFLYSFHERLFASEQTSGWGVAAALAMIGTDGYILYRVERELGRARLVGHAELKGTGELATQGIYARVRHPRYAGMMLAVAGACLMAGTLMLWVVAGIWWLLLLFAVHLEEQELRERFGGAYAAYSERVPRFVPFRIWCRER